MANIDGEKKTKIQAPPRGAEKLLEWLLSRRCREAVTGDLREEYAESILPYLGRLRADVWYVGQVLSFVPRRIAARGCPRPILALSSLFTLICGCWLAFMEVVLRHPGYVMRLGLDVSIAILGAATLLVSLIHLRVRSERWAWAAAVVLIGIGGQAFVHNARSAHFEGFAFVISLALVLQGALMLLSLGRAGFSSLPRKKPQ